MPTIAIINDDRNPVTSVSVALKAEGYRVAIYSDGASALDSFRTTSPDLAILDIKLPRINGMATLRQLRAKSDLPVILLSSEAKVVDEISALKMGADDFIRKPFSQSLLIARVKAVLRRASPNERTLPNKKVLEYGPSHGPGAPCL